MRRRPTSTAMASGMERWSSRVPDGEQGDEDERRDEEEHRHDAFEHAAEDQRDEVEEALRVGGDPVDRHAATHTPSGILWAVSQSSMAQLPSAG